jgi:hypothetical protein
MAAAASRFNPQPQPPYKPKSQIEAVKAPFTGTSTHHLDFPDFNPELYSAPRDSFKPKRSTSAAGSAPFIGASTYHDTFVPHTGASPTSSCRPDPSASQLKRPPTAFIGTSSYQSDYHEFDATAQARSPSFKPQAHGALQQRPFVGSSSYTLDFVGAKGERTANFKPQATTAASGGVERAKFQGRTQAQDSFVYMKPEPSRNFKPQPSAAGSSKDERTFSTTYQQGFCE